MASHTEFGAKTTATEVAKVFGDQIKGLTVLKTGVNPKGLGGATATATAEQHPAHIILTGRTQEKLDEVTKDLNFRFPKEVDAIDILLNDAGIMALPECEVSENGFEMHLATNYIGHFLLTNLLMDKIRLAATNRPGSSRVVKLRWVTSFPPSVSRTIISTVDPSQLMKWELENEPIEPYNSTIAYGQSKKGNMLFTTYLAKHLASYGNISLALHPGVIIHIEMGRYMPRETRLAMKDAVPNWKTQDEGAATSVVAAFHPALKGHSGAFLMDCQMSTAVPYAVDPEKAERLWKLTERFVGQEFKL